MSTREWVDAAIRLIDVSAWPLVAGVAILVVRKRLPAIGRWAASVAAQRGFTATTPMGSLRVEPPVEPGLIESADESALRQLAAAAPPAESAQLKQAAEKLEQIGGLREEVEEIWGSAPLGSTEARARRIAARGAVLLSTLTEEQRDGTIEFASVEADVDGDIIDWDTELTFSGPAASKALLLIESRGDWNTGLKETDYLTWVRAAEVMREQGIDVPVPPFESWQLAAVRRSNGYQWHKRRE